MARESERRRHAELGNDPVCRILHPAADAFLVKRGDGLSVLAGYPWYTDWGRIGLIALPGLTVAAGNLEAARQALETFARHCERGLLPNSFDELTGKPEYNSVDAPLWFIVAAWRWWQAGGDRAAAVALLPKLRTIVQAFTDGTRFDIGTGKDGLLSAGAPGSQLTWMDVKIEGYVPTPRHGKPVEVNALWFNALHMLAEMEEQLAHDATTAAALRKSADRVGASFVKTFWNAAGNCLHDVVREEGADDSIRPNQIFAVSLPFTPLGKDQQQAVLAVVTQHLLTPYGLRTLSPLHPKYCRQFAGNHRQRDFARHQGTVWPWLIGAYCDAYARVHGTGKAQRKEITGFLQGLLDHLDSAGTGSVSELFDGDAPHHPGGCIASAWAVGELLRAYATYAK
jgi:predicted glycogen debranching enzyme